MCLYSKETVKEKNKWLRKQPDMVTAYKVVRIKWIGEGLEMTPLYCHSASGSTIVPFKRTNTVRKMRAKSNSAEKYVHTYFTKSELTTHYIAYYHFFIEEEDAKNYRKNIIGQDGTAVIECLIPKESVTEIGMQGDRESIVARRFTIVGQDKYLEKK